MYHDIFIVAYHIRCNIVPWYLYHITVKFTMVGLHEIKYLAQANKNTVTVIFFFYIIFPPVEQDFHFTILATFDNFWRMNPFISASFFSGKTDLTSPKKRKEVKERRTDK